MQDEINEKNRCPVYQDQEADRRSAAKGNQKAALTGKERA